MAYVDLSRERLDSPLELTACLTKTDCILLRKKIKQDLFIAKKQYDRLKKIDESNVASKSQEASYVTAQVHYESLNSILSAINEVLEQQFIPKNINL